MILKEDVENAVHFGVDDPEVDDTRFSSPSGEENLPSQHPAHVAGSEE
jgi:hypothetical protein